MNMDDKFQSKRQTNHLTDNLKKEFSYICVVPVFEAKNKNDDSTVTCAICRS